MLYFVGSGRRKERVTQDMGAINIPRSMYYDGFLNLCSREGQDLAFIDDNLCLKRMRKPLKYFEILRGIQSTFKVFARRVVCRRGFYFLVKGSTRLQPYSGASLEITKLFMKLL